MRNKQSLFLRNKLLIICGPTATGKTSLALHLSKVLNGEIISADSRQIYKDMDIGTGKDLPQNSKIKIWGYDLVEPGEEFSVSQYQKFARRSVADIWQRGKLPILVGGTGLYLKSVVLGIETADIPKNQKLRDSLKNKKAAELLGILQKLDFKKAAKMNASDRGNPRRLVRAIEIAKYKSKNKSPKYGKLKADVLWVGLTAPLSVLKERIFARVEKRIGQGIAREMETLLQKGVARESQAMSALGYRQWPDVDSWKSEEVKYAKRQLTWFRKNKEITWFDISQKNWQTQVENWVKKWYSWK